MSRNENALAGFHLWLNLGLKVRPCASNGVFQALGVRQVFLGNVAEHFLHVRITLITGLKGRWLDVKGTTPNLDLSFAMFGCRVSLVETLKRTVVTLVQTPGLVDRQPVAVKLVKYVVKRVDCAL